ncbi:MAG: hypothetical protein R3321_01310 [Nitrososphaeraceae archaeon]|nr:hypothetical protein [Nitrososphaeraceae archaeon]
MQNIEKIFRKIIKGNYRNFQVSEDQRWITFQTSIMLGQELNELIEKGFTLEDIILYETDYNSDIVFKFRNRTLF